MATTISDRNRSLMSSATTFQNRSLLSVACVFFSDRICRSLIVPVANTHFSCSDLTEAVGVVIKLI